MTEELVVIFEINLYVLEATFCPSAGNKVHCRLVPIVLTFEDVELVLLIHFQ